MEKEPFQERRHFICFKRKERYVCYTEDRKNIRDAL